MLRYAINQYLPLALFVLIQIIFVAQNQAREPSGNNAQNSSNNHSAELCAATASNTQNSFRN